MLNNNYCDRKFYFRENRLAGRAAMVRAERESESESERKFLGGEFDSVFERK